MFAQLDVEATKIAVRICRVTITTVKIRVKVIFADQMLCARLKIMLPNAIAQPVLKAIQRQNKVAFEFHRRAFQRADARMVTCVLRIRVKCLAAIQFHVQLERDAIIMFARKFASQITTVCQAKYVMNVEHAKPVANQKLIVHQHKFALAESVSVVAVLSEHRSVALTSMSVPIKCVIRVRFVKIHQDHLNVFALNKLLAIHIRRPDVCFRINALEMKIVPRIWHVSKENAPNHVQSLNADAMPFVKEMIIEHFVSVHQVIWEIQPIKSPVASELNASTTEIAVKINSAINKSTNAKVSSFIKLL